MTIFGGTNLKHCSTRLLRNEKGAAPRVVISGWVPCDDDDFPVLSFFLSIDPCRPPTYGNHNDRGHYFILGCARLDPVTGHGGGPCSSGIAVRRMRRSQNFSKRKMARLSKKRLGLRASVLAC